MKNTPAAKSVEDQAKEALESPIKAPRLSKSRLKGKKVVDMVDDTSRPTPTGEVAPLVLEELEKAGADRKTSAPRQHGIFRRGEDYASRRFKHRYS